MATRLISRNSLKVVGVLNLTPDSFSDGGRFVSARRALAQANLLQRQGAHIIDVGGESTRPGALPVDVDEEQRRVLRVVAALASLGTSVSIDTMHAATAAAAVQAGARIVNDVSGGLADPDLFPALAPLDCQLVLGHLRGTPQTMDRLAHYGDVVGEVAAELAARASCAESAGIRGDRIVLDPGIGFAKTSTHNWGSDPGHGEGSGPGLSRYGRSVAEALFR